MGPLPDLTIPKPWLLASCLIAVTVLAGAAIGTAAAGAVPSGGVGVADPSGSGGDRSTDRRGELSSAVRGGGRRSSDRTATARYERLWQRRVSKRDKRWARKTSECESGRDPDAIGGGGRYRGAFQFTRTTWRHSPKSPGGDPIAYPYRTQAVVAVFLMHRDGPGHWPVCG